jgi:hypothetical protein
MIFTPHRMLTPDAKRKQRDANYREHLIQSAHIVAPAVLKYNAPISAQIFRAHDVAACRPRTSHDIGETLPCLRCII